MAGKAQIHDDEAAEGEDADGDGKGKGKGKPKVKKPAGPITLVIFGAIALFVAVLGAQVAAPILTKMIAGDPNAPAEASAEDEEQLALAEEEPVAEEPASGEHAEPLAPAIYVPLDPPFVVSFSDSAGDNRFLQLTLQAMARDEHTIEAVKTHAPAIRNAFLFLISGFKVEDLATLEGKEKLRASMLVAANEIMEKNTGEPGIEELYFTSLVIQ
jgi:flagellar protein FliL